MRKEAGIDWDYLPNRRSFLDLGDPDQQLPPEPPKKSLFQVSPTEMVFQNFVAHEVSEMVLSIMNKDKIARMVKVCMESSPYFQLACPSDVYHVVPPGASAHVRIRFTPEENKDYSHELVCKTAKENIVVPIRAICARAVLVFPDQLDFSTCPVNHSTQKTLLVRNVGNLEAHYQLSTQSPFSVVPATGTLGAGDTMEVTVGFHPLTNDDYAGSLCCNTGEEIIHTKLYGEAVDVNVVLSTNSVKFDKTFITMSNQTTMYIENRSNITAHFQWKAFPAEEDDNEEKKRQCRLLQPSSEVWLENFMEEKEIEKEKGFCEDHTALLSSMVQEKMAKVQEDPLLFSNDFFFIEPMEGEVRPNCSAKIKVTFKPLEAVEYQSVAYCSISGRESRPPLYLRGEGQGPLVGLSSDTLSLGYLFIDTFYVYEVKLINQGALDAPFTYIPSTTNVDFSFKFAPEEGIIAPGGTQTIQVSFKTTMLGWFQEEFRFSVAESPTPVILTIRGCVTGPRLHFDVPELDFGDISFGFPYTKSCRLTNNSVVPVTFKLRVLDDGAQPAVSSFDQIRSDSDPSWRNGIDFCLQPREFTMNPSQGTILPQGHQDIKVTLCSNTVTTFCRRMLVDLEGIAEGVTSLILRARCLVPELRVYPRVLQYKECYLKVPYERSLYVSNPTNIPGCYGLIPQERKEDTPVLYSSPKPCGIVQPRSTAEIPVVVEVQALGTHHTSVVIGVFGDERNPLRAELQSSGLLEKIYPSPCLIKFGTIQALQPTSQSFTLFNKGLIPADFRIEITEKPHCFVIEPREGVIPARGEVPVTITATLDDTGLFCYSIKLFIGNSLWTTFLLEALSIGTTIVIDKPFTPEINFGYQFSFLPCVRRFKVTNRGCRFHRLFWKADCCSPPEEEAQSVSALSSPKDDSQSPKRANPAFGVEPWSMELQPGQSVDMVLRGFSRIAQEVQDAVFCEAMIGLDPKPKKIIETIVTCEFIHPSIEVSARQFSFRVEKKPSDVLRLQYQPLSLKNTCLLPLDLMLDLEQPFLVCDKDQQPLPDGQPLRLDVGETCHLYVAFDPAFGLDLKSWKKEKVLKIDMVRGHPFVEHITLRGEVHFPNLQIQPSTLDFGCILAGTEEVRSLKMTNCSPLPVQYHWSFHSSSQVNRLRDELYPPKFKPQPPRGKITCLDRRASQWRHFRIRKEEGASTLKEVQDLNQSLGVEVPPQTPEHLRIPLGLEEFRCSIDFPYTPLEAEKAFRIVPLSGVLQPGESQQVSVTFCGHLNTICNVTVLCHVEGGPSYKVVLTGEASRVSYSLRPREISCGSQMFNEIHHSNVTLANSGKIEFSWVLNPSPADKHLPGVFLVKPTTGSIAPGKKQVLKFSYMPGLPGAFSRTYQLKVGDLDPENICLKGEASFPMISVNLPWNIKGNEKYEKTLKRLIKRRQLYTPGYKSVVQKKTQSPKSETLKSQTPTIQTLNIQNAKTQDLKPHISHSGIVLNTQMQIKMMNMLIERTFLELQQILPSHPPKSRFPDKELCQSLVKVELLEYVLDMGPVLKGYTETHTLKITNPGQIPVSFQANGSVLQDTGFSVDLDQKNGLPPKHTMAFDVRFESAHRPQGDVEVVLPIEVTQGPTYNIRLRATVLELSLNLSKNRLQFSDILVGQCQVETIRLYNQFRVPCKWFITASKPVLKKNHLQYMTPAIREKRQTLEDEPCPFEVTPSKGTLDPGKWQNLHIQFTPKEERSYNNELELNIHGSSSHLKLRLSGQGLQPRLEFSPPAVKMGWMLVDSDGVEATVVVKNPCNFPTEFYSLDFDEQYLEEEKILRMAVGSEYQKSFFMPPRAVGETLPPEVLEDYEAQKRPEAQQEKLEAMAETKARAEAKAKAKAMGKAAAAYRTVTFCPESLVKMTGNPISRAVMRHLGIDPSSGRCEAQQHRGIVVIVHGPPRAGKTEIAAGLCQYYDAAYVSIGTVVEEAMANDQSPAGLCARELCTKAAKELKDKDEGDAGKNPQTKNKRASGEKVDKKDAKDKTPPAQKKRDLASKLDKKDTKFTVSTAPAPQQLNIISSSGKELNCLSCVLPEDLLVDILSERLKRKDCSKGVIFDGLESLFAGSLESSLLCILKAVKNCHHIYMVNLYEDYASWKARGEAERKRKEAEREKEELQWEKAVHKIAERVLQVDEEEYNALPKEKKAEVDKIILEKKRIWRKRELKQLAQKLEEAKALEEEERRKEEERQKEEEKLKKEKKGVSVRKQPPKPEKEKTKPSEKKETKPPENKTKPPEKETQAPENRETRPPENKETQTPEKKESQALQKKETQAIEKKETKAPEKKETKPPKKMETKIPEKWKYKAPKMCKITIPKKGEAQALKKGEAKAPKKGENKIPEDPAEMENNLILRFQIYESSQQNVAQVFSYWDRVQGTVQLPVIQKGNKSQSSAENKGQKTSKPQEKVEKKPEQKSGDQRSLQSSQLDTQSEVAEGAVREEHVGVPCLDIQVSDPKAMIREILREGKLPTEDEMLKHVGLHPDGPPLPPGGVLSIVEYPEERLGSAERVEPFTIVAPEGAAVEDNLAKAPQAKSSSAKGRPKTGKAASRDSSAKEKHISTQRTESPRDSSATRSKSTWESASTPTEFLRLKRYRWIVPAHGEVELKVHFSAKKPGKFEQTLRFELMQSKCQYELPCSGTGLYPSICQNPRVVFPQWRKTMKEDEVIFKEYVESTKQFHFGPLLCGKSREWYKAQNCPNNSENITILNNSPMDVKVKFSFKNDGKTFLLDPPSMTLKPKEKQKLTIWAYPTSPGFLEDKLICRIGKNPDPVVFSLCCHGVHVKLEVSPRQLYFDKLLLHRTDSRTLVLRNNTLLPMAWQLNGLDDLVEDFSLSQNNGTIDPHSEFEVTLQFKAEQIGSIEKTLRLEVSDTENILGIVQAENIKVSAEVYDVSLSIDMPEGPDGILEFGTINVLDNVKKVLSLKNKGRYNIEYSFTVKGAGPRTRDVASHFTVAPQSGILIASQPGVNVEILFHPTSEMLLKNRPILYCQVIDASSGEGGQAVAIIPVNVSAKAVYSKYSIEPASPINFGAMIKGTKKTQTVVLENKGMLNFKFYIRQAPEETSTSESKSSKQGESAPLATKQSTARKPSSLTQSHLSLGMFTVSPCSGSISPWGQQKITVECLAGQEGTCEEQLYIDIPGRDPKDNPLGIPFTLTAESCLPGFAEDVMLIFEEYPICSSTDLSRKLQSVKGLGLFIRDENKFIFNKVLVGQEAEAHFSIYSASSLPCDVVLSIKPLPGKEQIPIKNIFKLDPVKMSVPGSSCAVATVTFTPPDEQNYNCTFKASLVIPKGSVKMKPQTLTFTISGQAHEPQLTVVRPSARSKRGTAVLRFQRLRVGRSEVLPLVIRNDGITPLKFMLRLEHEYGAFFLKGRDSTLKVFHTEDVGEDSTGNESKPTKPFFLLRCGQSTEFDVIFKPTLAQRLEGKIRLLVGNIYSNKVLVELVGEGHKDKFTLVGLEEDTRERNAKSSLNKDIIDAVRVNHMQFGDCPVGKPCRRTFTMSNHTRHQFMRFEWEADGPFQLSPKVGHLRPRRAKEITVTLKSDVPATFRRHLVKCKVTKINFELPPRKVPDWDDQKITISWWSTPSKDSADKSPKIERVVKVAPEPVHTVVEESSQEVEVYLSAVVGYTELKLSTVVVQFKDTLPFHTRTATFSMHNTGKAALEYYWEEPADKPVKKPYSITLMRRFLSYQTVKNRRKLLRRYWRYLARLARMRPKVRPRERRPDKNELFMRWWCRLIGVDPKELMGSKVQEGSEDQDGSKKRKKGSKKKQQQDSEQQQQQQDSKQQQQQQQQQGSKQQQSSEEEQLDSKQKGSKKRSHSKEQHVSEQQQQPSEQQKQQSSEEEQLDSKQKKGSKKQSRSKEQHLSHQQLQQPSEQQKQQSSEEEQLDSKQKKGSKKQSRSKERHLSEQQQSQQQPEQQPEQQPSEQPEQPEQQPEQQQQPKKPVPSKKRRRSKEKHLSLKHVTSSMEIFPDFTDDLALFSIDPYRGTLAPGQKQTFHVRFAPKCAGKFETTMLCRIPNLRPTQKKVRVILKGRAREKKSFGKPKRSALQQREDGPRPKKQVHWKPAPE
ncbi:hydrocephalus-inducing protein homolog isoform X2 [Passer domesticus]